MLRLYTLNLQVPFINYIIIENLDRINFNNVLLENKHMGILIILC